MKQYFAFYGDYYYPGGGMKDFVGDYDTKNEAIEAIENAHSYGDWENSWGHIWDTKDMIKVYNK